MRICTSNPHKASEFAGLLLPLAIDLEPLDLDVPETGDTFEHNALEKAYGYATHARGEWVLVDDSGLVVPALDGLPGPWSARFSDLVIETRTVQPSGRARAEIDPENNRRLLELLEATPDAQRGAYFVACVIVVDPEGEVAFQTSRRAYGWILREARGSGGFGYDPVFASDTSFGKAWAELDDARKSLISHRAHALWDFQAWVCTTERKVA